MADTKYPAQNSHEKDTNSVRVGANPEPAQVNRYRPTKWQSNITILSCYIANFADGYQNSLANPTNVIFKHLLGSDFTSEMKTRISNALLIGAILGIIALGYASDMFSRRAGLLFTSGLVAIGTLMATVALSVHPTSNMLWYFVVVRGITGFGVGGEYPPSASAGIEESDEFMHRFRGPMFVSFTTLMATTAGPILMIIYLVSLVASNNNLVIAFHAIYSIATILPVIIIVLRVFMADSTLFHYSNFTQQRRKSLKLYFLLAKRYWWRIFTTSLAFFLYDFINFPNSIMSSTIISSLVKDNNVRTTAIWQVILAALPVPGVLVGAWLTNAIGRRWTGIVGFVGYMVLGFIIGGLYTKLSQHIAAFVVLYGLLQAFGHMGPGATIGLISCESYPTAMRSMGYGIAEAFGRTGAAVGTQCFTPLQDKYGDSSTFYLAGAVAVLGIAVYGLLPESGNLHLEKEDKALKVFLEERGGYTTDTR